MCYKTQSTNLFYIGITVYCSVLLWVFVVPIAQLAGAVEYTDCNSAEG